MTFLTSLPYFSPCREFLPTRRCFPFSIRLGATPFERESSEHCAVNNESLSGYRPLGIVHGSLLIAYYL